MENTTINDIRLSPHFSLSEFLNVSKYADNKPTMQDVANMTYGCLMLLEPARRVVGPILINSGSTSLGIPSQHHYMMLGLDTTNDKIPRKSALRGIVLFMN